MCSLTRECVLFADLLPMRTEAMLIFFFVCVASAGCNGGDAQFQPRVRPWARFLWIHLFSFIYSFIHFFIRSFICLFVYLFACHISVFFSCLFVYYFICLVITLVSTKVIILVCLGVQRLGWINTKGININKKGNNHDYESDRQSLIIIIGWINTKVINIR